MAQTHKHTRRADPEAGTQRERCAGLRCGYKGATRGLARAPLLWQRRAALAAFDVLSRDSWRAYWVSPGVTSTGELRLLLCSSQDRNEPQEAPVGAEGSPADLALLQGGRAWLWEEKGHRPLDVLRACRPRARLVLQHHVHPHAGASSAQTPHAPSDQPQPVPTAPSLHVLSSLSASISPFSPLPLNLILKAMRFLGRFASTCPFFILQTFRSAGTGQDPSHFAPLVRPSSTHIPAAFLQLGAPRHPPATVSYCAQSHPHQVTICFTKCIPQPLHI